MQNMTENLPRSSRQSRPPRQSPQRKSVSPRNNASRPSSNQDGNLKNKGKQTVQANNGEASYEDVSGLNPLPKSNGEPSHTSISRRPIDNDDDNRSSKQSGVGKERIGQNKAPSRRTNVDETCADTSKNTPQAPITPQPAPQDFPYSGANLLRNPYPSFGALRPAAGIAGPPPRSNVPYQTAGPSYQSNIAYQTAQWQLRPGPGNMPIPSTIQPSASRIVEEDDEELDDDSEATHIMSNASIPSETTINHRKKPPMHISKDMMRRNA
ncbi:hypothetical protein N0V90_000381 [Kalmusia sp. IMI 367209]|nr:hypothetical protein N0V90_000381 [Kalmusia sp. IMI 367209]